MAVVVEDQSELIFSTYDDLKNTALKCTRCDLSTTRNKVVFSSGPGNCDVMVIGEAPGASEDETGIPFVGRGGQMLNKLFEEVGIFRNNIYIANVLKCRPPENRNPKANEIHECSSYLWAQIKFVKPKVIVPVGNFSTRFLLKTKDGIMSLRGKKFPQDSYIVVPTVHPAYVLRNGTRGQKEMLEDLKVVKNILDKKI